MTIDHIKASVVYYNGMNTNVINKECPLKHSCMCDVSHDYTTDILLLFQSKASETASQGYEHVLTSLGTVTDGLRSKY